MENVASELDEEGYLIWNDKCQLPIITISVTMMTEDQFSEWFRDNVEANA
jgi:hypothetical protein